MNVAAIQDALAADGLDGWLLYDFRGSNPIAVALAGVGGLHTTRRWFYFVPARGTPVKLVHAIEAFVLDALPGETRTYAERHALERGVAAALGGARTVAMEYSPANAIPYVSRVDAGTIEFIRGLGVTVVSSGDLVGRFEAAWDESAVASHRRASERLYRIKDRTFAFVRAALAAGTPLDEFGIQEAMTGWFREEGLVSDAPPIVAAQEHTGNPHYEPAAARSRPFRRGELLLLDLWGKLATTDAVYADITWMGFAGEPPSEIARVFGLAVAARDQAIALVRSRIASREPLRGWEVDRAARDVITAGGYGHAFIHRTGHSLGRAVHGNGAHMDDYETHDDRRLLPGLGFTIEPGIYLPAFGVRTEINMLVATGSAEVTGPCQIALERLA